MSVEWVNRTVAPTIASLGEFVFFCDTLESQVSLPFSEVVCKLNGIFWYGFANGTDLWRPTDVGAGYFLKKLIDEEQQLWLEDEDHIGQ